MPHTTRWIQPALFLTALAALLTGTTFLGHDLIAMAICLAAGVALGATWLWRAARRGLPRTGLEIPLLAFLVGEGIACVVSPVPRMGMERLAWLAFGAIIFYAVVDLLNSDRGDGDQQAAVNLQAAVSLRTAMLLLTGPLLGAALVETYARYWIWWGQAGSQVMPPFQIRFLGLVVHPNTFVALMNLAAPLALVWFLRTRSRTTRVLCAFWLMMYLMMLPFSSSRAGWMGAAGGFGLLALLWLAENGRWKARLAWLTRRLALTIPAGLALIAAAGAAAYKFYMVFAANNPTHGTALNLNRELMWSGAVQLFTERPLTGSGPGRLGVEFLRVTQAFPATWWPGTAHSTPLQVLGESGLVGFLPFTALVIAACVLFWRAYRATPASGRPWVQASLAALASALVHGIFEDYNTYPILIVFVGCNAALVLTACGPIPRFSRLRLGVLLVPAVGILAAAIFSLWGYAPLYQVASQKNIPWSQNAAAAAESARRDPAMPFYKSQAAIAFAMAWQQDGSPSDLEQSRAYFHQALALEGNNSIFWADLAILDAYAGQTGEALQAIQRAIQLCPAEPSFYVNYGWLLEQSGKNIEASAQYRRALEINPRMVSHPFWSSSALRQQAAAETPPTQPVTFYWEKARAQITTGQLAQGQYNLALSNLFEEPQPANTLGWAVLAEKQGNLRAALDRLAGLPDALDYLYWGNVSGEGAYNLQFSRLGFPNSVVPGYLRTSEDFGQFDALPELSQVQVAAGQCKAAAQTWKTYQREIHAGELGKGNPAPACP